MQAAQQDQQPGQRQRDQEGPAAQLANARSHRELYDSVDLFLEAVAQHQAAFAPDARPSRNRLRYANPAGASSIAPLPRERLAATRPTVVGAMPKPSSPTSARLRRVQGLSSRRFAIATRRSAAAT